jgi:hypothetical protein
MWIVISDVGHWVLAFIGVVALAYSPVVVLGLYARLLDGGATIKPAAEPSNRRGRPEVRNE